MATSVGMWAWENMCTDFSISTFTEVDTYEMKADISISKRRLRTSESKLNVCVKLCKLCIISKAIFAVPYETHNK